MRRRADANACDVSTGGGRQKRRARFPDHQEPLVAQQLGGAAGAAFSCCSPPLFNAAPATRWRRLIVGDRSVDGTMY